MSSVDWRLADRLTAILRKDIARTDDELIAMLGCDRKELGRMVGILYRQGKVDRCREYLVLSVRQETRHV